jgi:ubiquinol-cytochrome c reductase cytochrome c subunit
MTRQAHHLWQQASLSLLALLAVFGSPAAFAAQGKPAATPAEESVGNAARGRELFISNGCFACHGYDGQGGSYTGPRLAPNPLPWQAIAVFIRNPRGLEPPYTNWPFNVMPPFTSRLVPDKDVQDIYAWLKSRPAPTDLKNIPTFSK